MAIDRLRCNVFAYYSSSCVAFQQWFGLCRRRHLVDLRGKVVRIRKCENRLARVVCKY